MQLSGPLLAQQLNGAHADAQMLVHALSVKVVGHARQFDFAVQRFVAHTQQRAIGHTKPETVGGNRGAFHVECHGAALAEAALGRVVGQQFPVAVVGAGHGARAQDAFEFGALALRHIFHCLFQRHLNFSECWDGHPQR
jgi:hypothetical protein